MARTLLACLALCALCLSFAHGARDLKGEVVPQGEAQVGSTGDSQAVNSAAGYPLVNLFNSTPYYVTGKVEYASVFCSDDTYEMYAGTGWTATSRGVCLVTKISAMVITPGGPIPAESYTSSGTSYSTFIVVQTSPKSFAVTRKVT